MIDRQMVPTKLDPSAADLGIRDTRPQARMRSTPVVVSDPLLEKRSDRCVSHQWKQSEPQGSVQKRPTGVSSKPANGSGPEQLDLVPGHRLSIKLNRNFFLRSSKKSCSGARGRIFSRSPMVLVMAFPTPGVQSATWSSSSAAHI